MIRQWIYTFMLFFMRFLLLGILCYPVLSLAISPGTPDVTVPNDSSVSLVYTTTPTIYCKKVVIDYSNIVQEAGNQGGVTFECPTGYVAIGINNGKLFDASSATLGSAVGVTADWVWDTNPPAWVSYTHGPIHYGQGNAALNTVSMFCAPRSISFQAGQCDN